MKEPYNIAVIGDTSSGKTMLVYGLILTSKRGLSAFSRTHSKEVAEVREQLGKGVMPAGTTSVLTYDLRLWWRSLFRRILKIRAIEYALNFRDYKGGDIQNGQSFLENNWKDVSPDGVLFLMNPGQEALNLQKEVDADD